MLYSLALAFLFILQQWNYTLYLLFLEYKKSNLLWLLSSKMYVLYSVTILIFCLLQLFRH